MQFIRSDATSLLAIMGNPPAKGSRVVVNDWDLYNHLTFQGSPGGPGVYPTPETKSQNGDLVMNLGGRTTFVDSAPPISASVGTSSTIWILAANREFLVSIPIHDTGGNYSIPALMYVHARLTGAWRKLESAGSMPQCRIFGDWLVTRSRNSKASDEYRDNSPGHNDESNLWVPYERPDVRVQYEYMDSPFYIPGILTLDNLVDGRRITLDTH